MNRKYYIELFQYTDWANRLVWDCAMKTTLEDFLKENDYSRGSIFEQLLHTLNVERWWIGYLATRELTLIEDNEREAYKDRDKLRQLWDETNENNMAYMQSLDDAELGRKVRVTWWDEVDPDITVAQALTQVANHSTDHRAQTMAVLHMLGYEGVGQDFLEFLHR